MTKVVNQAIALGVIGIAGFLIYKNLTKPPITQNQTQAALQNAGFTDAKFVGETVQITADNTTFGFQPGDFDKLNWAQKFLIGVDRFVPGTALTRAVLT